MFVKLKQLIEKQMNIKDALNLVFYGIAEAPQGETDNTESKLRDFLKHELELERPEKIDEIVFDRVHRLGRPRWNQHISSRPIVAKFERYKDREFVRQNSKTLNGKRDQYNIREQFPPEMEAKRKILYPVMRSYSRDPNNCVALVRDKLFINGELYIPPNPVGGSDIQSRDTQNDRDYSNGGPGNRRRARGVRLAQQPPSFESRNRFSGLSFADENRDVGRADSYSSFKRPASSPAYDEIEPKKYGTISGIMRDDPSSNDGSFSEMQTGDSQEHVTQSQTEEPGPSIPTLDLTQADSNEESVTSYSNNVDSATVNLPLNVQVDVHREHDLSSLTGQSDNVNTIEAEITDSSQ